MTISNKTGFKKTKQREVVIAILKGSKLPLTAEEIFLAAKKDLQKVNFSTVYRILKMLEGRGIIIKNIGNDGRAHYEYNNGVHHHYLTCLNCNKRIELQDCPFTNWEKKIADENDFYIERHSLDIYGYCGQCVRARKDYRQNNS